MEDLSSLTHLLMVDFTQMKAFGEDPLILTEGQGIRVRDIPVSPKWKPITEGEAMLVHVIMPKAEEVPAPAEAAAAAATAPVAEPEVIKKGKKEEEVEEKEEKKK